MLKAYKLNPYFLSIITFLVFVACTDPTPTETSGLPTPTPIDARSTIDGSTITQDKSPLVVFESLPTPVPTPTPIPLNWVLEKTTSKMDSVDSFSYLGEISITGEPSETIPFDQITYFLSGERYSKTQLSESMRYEYDNIRKSVQTRLISADYYHTDFANPWVLTQTYKGYNVYEWFVDESGQGLLQLPLAEESDPVDHKTYYYLESTTGTIDDSIKSLAVFKNLSLSLETTTNFSISFWIDKETFYLHRISLSFDTLNAQSELSSYLGNEKLQYKISISLSGYEKRPMGVVRPGLPSWQDCSKTSMILDSITNELKCLEIANNTTLANSTIAIQPTNTPTPCSTCPEIEPKPPTPGDFTVVIEKGETIEIPVTGPLSGLSPKDLHPDSELVIPIDLVEGTNNSFNNDMNAKHPLNGSYLYREYVDPECCGYHLVYTHGGSNYDTDIFNYELVLPNSSNDGWLTTGWGEITIGITQPAPVVSLPVEKDSPELDLSPSSQNLYGHPTVVGDIEFIGTEVYPIWSPDSEYISWAENGEVKLVRLADLHEIGFFDTDRTTHMNAISSIDWSHDLMAYSVNSFNFDSGGYDSPRIHFALPTVDPNNSSTVTAVPYGYFEGMPGAEDLVYNQISWIDFDDCYGTLIFMAEMYDENGDLSAEFIVDLHHKVNGGFHESYFQEIRSTKDFNEQCFIQPQALNSASNFGEEAGSVSHEFKRVLLSLEQVIPEAHPLAKYFEDGAFHPQIVDVKWSPDSGRIMVHMIAAEGDKWLDGQVFSYIFTIIPEEGPADNFKWHLQNAHPIDLESARINGTPVWSPDSSKVAFLYFQEDYPGLAVIEFDDTSTYVDGVGTTNVFDLIDCREVPLHICNSTGGLQDVSFIDLRWSPDGTDILLISPNDFSNEDEEILASDIYTFNVVETLSDCKNSATFVQNPYIPSWPLMNCEPHLADFRNITNTPSIQKFHAEYSPDGTKLMFVGLDTSKIEDSFLGLFDAKYEIYVMDLDRSPIPCPDDHSNCENYRKVVMEYFEEIAFSMEPYELDGVLIDPCVNETDCKLRRWEEDIKIKVSGEPTSTDLENLKDIVGELNLLLPTMSISVEDVGANIEVFFLETEDHKSIIGETWTPGNWGYFYTWWENFVINKAVITISSDKGNRAHYIREELTQALGLFNDSYKYPNSIFQQEHTETTMFNEIDKSIIRLLYNPLLEPGMTADEVRKAINIE